MYLSPVITINYKWTYKPAKANSWDSPQIASMPSDLDDSI